MSFMDSIKSSFSKFAQFNGRASKQEWLYFFLLYIGVGLVIGLINGATENRLGFLGLLNLILLVPMLAVSWRRFQDQGRNGVRTLIWLVPLVGWIIYIVWAIQPGVPGPNEHGPNPENPEAGNYGPQDTFNNQQGGYGQPQQGYGPQGGYGQPGPQA